MLFLEIVYFFISLYDCSKARSEYKFFMNKNTRYYDSQILHKPLIYIDIDWGKAIGFNFLDEKLLKIETSDTVHHTCQHITSFFFFFSTKEIFLSGILVCRLHSMAMINVQWAFQSRRIYLQENKVAIVWANWNTMHLFVENLDWLLVFAIIHSWKKKEIVIIDKGIGISIRQKYFLN